MTRACRDCKWAKLPPIDIGKQPVWCEGDVFCRKLDALFPQAEEILRSLPDSVNVRAMKKPDDVCDKWEPWTTQDLFGRLCQSCREPDQPGLERELRFCQKCWDRAASQKGATDETP